MKERQKAKGKSEKAKRSEKIHSTLFACCLLPFALSFSLPGWFVQRYEERPPAFDLPDHFVTSLMNVNAYLGDPWARVIYPLDLRPVLEEIGSRFAVSIGCAMRDIE